ncbi:hypothetical protein SSX86_026037 [Deinandra increscens subsp. villosa]|uniref:Uncharacterized protein n=1 Tax=Deinandra increscens subsp. villosa TaxID=3103831 RepID=A0AAP0GLX6_9ASTR
MERLDNSNTNNFAVTNITDPNSTPFLPIHSFNATDCLVCYALSRTTVPTSFPATSAAFFSTKMLCSSVMIITVSSFHERIDPVTDARNCNSSNNLNDFEFAVLEFNRSVGELVEIVTRLAVNNGGFCIPGAQCWESSGIEECRLSTTIVVDEPAPGLKAILSFKVPDQKANYNTCMTLLESPQLLLCSGNQQYCIGTESLMYPSTKNGNFTKYYVGISFADADLIAALTL